MWNFLTNEDGQGMVEYALIIALVSIIAMGTLGTLGKTIDGKFGDVNTALG